MEYALASAPVARRGQRALGILLVLAGVAWNVQSLGWWLSKDHRIANPTSQRLILAFQAATVLLGIALWLRNSGVRLGVIGRWSVTGVLSISVFLGGMGTVLSISSSPQPREKPPVIWDLNELCARLRASRESHMGDAYLEKVRGELETALTSDMPTDQLITFHERLSRALLASGDPVAAVEQMQHALALALEAGLPMRNVNLVRFRLAVALLRRGEVDHCLQMHNPESCLFPVSGMGVWSDPSGARAASEVLEEILRLDPSLLGARWLLNVANMTAGTYPDGVPPEFLISPTPVEAPADPSSVPFVPRFRDVAPDLGVGSADCAGGAVMDDVDGDGFLDVVSSSLQACAPMHYHHNQGDGTFADYSESSGLAEQLGAFNLFQADYDGDGRLDILAVRGAWLGPMYGRQRDSLLHQEPDGTFRDATRESGVGARALPTSSAGWADFDLDGDLDVYIGNEGFPNELFQNEGDGTFRDVAETAGAADRGMTKGIALGDADNDGDPDLYVSHLGQPNLFFQNEGDGTFAENGEEVGLRERTPGTGSGNATFATWFFDYDNDGWLDLWVSGFNASLGEFTADSLGLPSKGARSRLYRNQGDGSFRNVASEAGVARVLTPMGSNFGDVNNDGFLDIYLGTGKPQFEWLVPNVLFVNGGGVRFYDRTAASGLGHLQKGHGVAFGDLDNDGDQDVFVQIGGFFKADGFLDSLFENPGTPHHWITLVLRGVSSNRHGVGTRIQLDLLGPDGPRRVHALAGSGSSFGSSSLQQEIGLGSAERIERIELVWPASGLRQVLENVPLDCFVEITEASNEIRVLDRPRVRLAGSAESENG